MVEHAGREFKACSAKMYLTRQSVVSEDVRQRFQFCRVRAINLGADDLGDYLIKLHPFDGCHDIQNPRVFFIGWQSHRLGPIRWKTLSLFSQSGLRNPAEITCGKIGTELGALPRARYGSLSAQLQSPSAPCSRGPAKSTAPLAPPFSPKGRGSESNPQYS